jgi:hypothetical protein
MDVHVVDTSSPTGLLVCSNLTRISMKHVISLDAPQSNAVPVMVGRIMAEAQKSSEMIMKLAIWGHGHAGAQGVSRGTDADGDRHWAGIDLDVLENEHIVSTHTLTRTLKQLWDVLDWDGWVELRGCNVAEGARGQRFLNVLADIWQVPVYAGEVFQVVSGLRGLAFAWTGTVHIAKPGMSGTTTFQGQVAAPK